MKNIIYLISVALAGCTLQARDRPDDGYCGRTIYAVYFSSDISPDSVAVLWGYDRENPAGWEKEPYDFGVELITQGAGAGWPFYYECE